MVPCKQSGFMKLLQSIWSLASENGGPTRSTIGLSKALAQAGVQVTLISHVPGKLSQTEQNGLAASGVVFREGRSVSYRIALQDSQRLLDEVRPAIVHVQGMWKPSTHAMNVAASRAGIPIVISPRGMLAPWALSVKKWKKRIGMFLYQFADLERAAAFHAASDDEAGHIKRFGMSQPVMMVPNGVNLPEKWPSKPPARPDRIRTALFLSRMHPGKGLMLLAEAWAALRPQGWRMMAVGSNERGHGDEVRARVKELGIADSWTFHDEVDDTEKWYLYRSADLFMHPSASENFGLSIAEALASGLPVITTKGCPWAEIQGSCGWWIDRDRDSLVAAMNEAMSLTDVQRQEMGERGSRLIGEKYAWSVIARQMIDGYESLLCR